MKNCRQKPPGQANFTIYFLSLFSSNFELSSSLKRGHSCQWLLAHQNRKHLSPKYRVTILLLSYVGCRQSHVEKSNRLLMPYKQLTMMEKMMDPNLICNNIINYATSSKITIEYCYLINFGNIDEILIFLAQDYISFCWNPHQILSVFKLCWIALLNAIRSSEAWRHSR